MLTTWRRRVPPLLTVGVGGAPGPVCEPRSHGPVDTLQNDPRWRDNITFFEYFHADTGAGLGATHQTGWTGLVADLICRPDPFAADPTGLWSR